MELMYHKTTNIKNSQNLYKKPYQASSSTSLIPNPILKPLKPINFKLAALSNLQ